MKSNKPVLIISTSNDNSTNNVIDWLTYRNKDFLRLNSEDIIDDVCIKISDFESDFEFTFKKKKYLLSEFNSFWYRRGIFKIKSNSENRNELDKAIANYRSIQNLSLYNYFFKSIRSKTHINKYHDIFINKLDILLIAMKAGFQIPRSILTKNPNDLSQKIKVITKSFTDHQFTFNNEGNSYYAGAMTIKINDKILSNEFNYSFFQEMVKKKFEIRLFFLHDKIFASAVFSQNDKKTIIDFRNYNNDKPNRVVPIKLPDSISVMIKTLMNSIDMNIASIDIIYDENKNYVFLEINPVGQFEQVSYPCNYYLEREIAKILA